MAHRWFDWVCELGGTEHHSLYLIPASGLDISDLITKSSRAFHGNVNIIKDEEEQKSDWQITEFMRSASGPNSAFRQVAWHFYNGKLGPYFWCELDCIPLAKDWLDRLESEYKACGKPFMGADVQIESVPPHMSGNGIYQNVPENAPTLVKRTNWIPSGQNKPFELAFDIAGAREVLPKCHFTNLIQHKFRWKGFETPSEFYAVIDPNAVVFHSDKKGTIYKYLRENLSGGLIAVQPLEVAALPIVDPAQSTWTGSTGMGDGGNVSGCSGLTGSSGTVVNRTFPSEELESVIAQQSVIRNGLPAMSPPWENREDTERDVKMLCDTLHLFCGSPVYKGRVRQALREAKIIK